MTFSILHVYKDYFPVLGGIENHVRALAEAQASQGHAVTVLVNSLDRRTHIEMMNGVRVLRAARLFTAASTPISLALPARLRRERPAIVHLHFPYPWGEVSALAFGRHAPWVITYHSDIVRQRALGVLYRPLMRQVLGHAGRIIATSPRYVESSPVLRRFAEKCAVVPLGVDVRRFAHADGAAIADIRRRFGAPLLLFVGKLRYYKGLDTAIKALGQIPEAHLLIVGDGPMREAWEKMAGEAGVAERTHFAGEVDDDILPAFYHACEVFILPAAHRSEAFGTVLIEAMAGGKPLITTELGTGTSWVNQHGGTGLVVPPSDPSALAEAVRTLLEHPQLRQEMGERGRRRAAEAFTIERMVEGVEGVYREVLAE